MADYNLSVTAADLNSAITKANNAAPQSTTYTKAEVNTALSAKANTSDLATVATSGSYDDLTNKPTLGAAAAKGVDVSPTASSTNLVESGGVATALSGKQDALTAAQQAAADSGITSAKVAQYDSTTGYGTAIPSGADLNNYTASGQFYIATSTIWGSITNVPAMERSTNARLLVIGLNADSDVRCTQILVTNFGITDQEGRLYMRQLYSADTWSPWYMFQGTVVL